VCFSGVSWALKSPFDPNSPLPNPNNMPYAVQGSGTYKLDQGEFFVGILFYAENTKSGDKNLE